MIFPVVYVVARHSTLYDGVRHLLFIVPPLVVLAAVGWVSAIAATAGAWRAAVALLLMAGLAEPLVFQVQNHPNQVAYLQPLVGGPRAAYMRFEMDYWGNCLFEAVKQTADVARAASAPVTISGRREHQLRLNAARVHDVVISGRNDRSHELEVGTPSRHAARVEGIFEAQRHPVVRDDVRWRRALCGDAGTAIPAFA